MPSIGPKPPTPSELIASGPYQGAARGAKRAFRREGLIAPGAEVLPDSINNRTQQGRLEAAQLWFDESLFGAYDPRKGSRYSNDAADPVDPMDTSRIGMLADPSKSSDPAPISESPTSTIYPPRPRTVAAGYLPSNKERTGGKLTVVFRDGTYYNYYNVAPITWYRFRRAYSKGRFISSFLDGHQRGPANTFGSDRSHWEGEGYMETLYRAARAAQVKQGGLQKGQNAKSWVRRQNWHASSYKGKYKAPQYVGRSKPSPRYTRSW